MELVTNCLDPRTVLSPQGSSLATVTGIIYCDGNLKYSQDRPWSPTAPWLLLPSPTMSLFCLCWRWEMRDERWASGDIYDDIPRLCLFLPRLQFSRGHNSSLLRAAPAPAVSKTSATIQSNAMLCWLSALTLDLWHDLVSEGNNNNCLINLTYFPFHHHAPSLLSRKCQEYF